MTDLFIDKDADDALVPAGLPPGVHPSDPSVPWDGGRLDEDLTVPLDTFGQKYDKGQKPWGTGNGDALPVWERASHDFTADTITVTVSTQIVGRQPGRKNVTLSVAATGVNGVIFAPTQGEVDQLAGITINPGESRTISTEAPVWAGPLSGNSTGTVQVMCEINPPGGSLGSM